MKAVEAGEEMCLQEEEGAHPGKGRGAHDPPEEAGRAEGVHRGGRASERLQKVWSDLKGVICARNGATQYRWGCRYPEGCCWGWNAWPASKLILTGSGGQPSDEGEAGSHRCGGGIEEKEGATRQISGGGFSSRCNFTERGCEGEQEEVTQVVGPLKESEEKEKEKAQLQRGFEEPVQWEQQLERRQPSSSAQAEVAEVAGSGAQDVGRTCLREAGTRCDSGGRPGREHELSGEGHGSCLVSLAPTQVARQQGELFLLARSLDLLKRGRLDQLADVLSSRQSRRQPSKDGVRQSHGGAGRRGRVQCTSKRPLSSPAALSTGGEGRGERIVDAPGKLVCSRLAVRKQAEGQRKRQQRKRKERQEQRHRWETALGKLGRRQAQRYRSRFWDVLEEVALWGYPVL